MNRTSKAITFGVGTVVALGAGTGIAVATSGDDGSNDNDVSITGEALDRASEAALEHTGQGTVVDSEVDNDAENYYEVEVELDDGSITEVELSQQFEVLGTESDEGADDD